MRQFKIEIPGDVAKFFFWLVFERSIDIHPDDPIDQYINLETKEPTFTLEEALYYERVRQKCFDVCMRHEVDIYGIATRTVNLFHYCDKNDVFEQLTRQEQP